MGGFIIFCGLVTVMVGAVALSVAAATFRGHWASLAVAWEQRMTLPLAVAVDNFRVSAAYRAHQARAVVGVVADVTLCAVGAAMFIIGTFGAAFTEDWN